MARRYTYIRANHPERKSDDEVSALYAWRRRHDGGIAFSGSHWIKARDFVFARDGSCRWCGSPDDLELDHIVERRLKPDHSYDNLQALCRPCHLAKTKAYQAAITALIRAHADQFGEMLGMQQEIAKLVRISDVGPVPAELEVRQPPLF